MMSRIPCNSSNDYTWEAAAERRHFIKEMTYAGMYSHILLSRGVHPIAGHTI